MVVVAGFCLDFRVGVFVVRASPMKRKDRKVPSGRGLFCMVPGLETQHESAVVEVKSVCRESGPVQRDKK